MEDRSIIDLYWARSEAAITETSFKYGRYCKSIADNILHNDADSDECVNDTFLNAWNAMPSDRPGILSVYLGRITRNLSLNRYKREQQTQKRGGGRVVMLLDELKEVLPAEEWTIYQPFEGEIARSISAFLNLIGEEERMIFVRRYWYADSVKSITGRFALTESKVKSMLFRTRNKLKSHLEEEGIEV
jgi:RNA polymerase sigma-70 factor (ECF subfamily)